MDDLQALLETLLGGPVSPEQVMAFQEAVGVCNEPDYDEEMGPAPKGKGKGLDLAIVFDGPKKKK